MKKKIIITVIFAFILLPVALAFADTGFLISGGNKVEAGKQLSFKIDLEKIPETEYGPYTIAISITPTEPQLWLDVKENVDVVVNRVNGTYALKSEDLVNLKSLNFVMSPDSALKESVSYTVKVNVAGANKVSDEEFTFEAVPLTPKKEKYEGGGSSGGDSGGDVDPKYVYNGSADNYLNSLSVSGYKLNETFDKTRTVYFLDVKNAVSQLSVSAVPSDRKTHVYIVGNNDVSADMSKITISLRAENGNVRVYKIYVRHQEDK